MSFPHVQDHLQDHVLLESLLRRVSAQIAPAWPLETMVAVTPYLGLSELGFASSRAAPPNRLSARHKSSS